MRCHARYLRGRSMLPFSLPTFAYLSMADTKFQALKYLNTPLPPLTLPPFPLWMSLATINPIDDHSALRRNLCHCRNVESSLEKSVWGSLLEDS